MFKTATIKTGAIGAKGILKLRASRPTATKYPIWKVFADGLPNWNESKAVNWWRFKNFFNLWRGFWRVVLASLFKIPTHYGVVRFRVFRADGRVENLGTASFRVVTDAGVQFIVDAFQNTKEVENFRFHGFGTGTNAEAVGNVALQTELTTQYATDNTRPTGSQGEGATANVYRTIATLTPDAGVAITEHAIFDQAATGGGSVLDRSVFSGNNLSVGDSLQSQYDLVLASGS